MKKPPEWTYPYKGLLRGDIKKYKAHHVQSQYLSTVCNINRILPNKVVGNLLEFKY